MKILHTIATTLRDALFPQQRTSLYWSQKRRQHLLRRKYRAANACLRREREAQQRESAQGAAGHA